MTACPTLPPFDGPSKYRPELVCLEYQLIKDHYGDRTAERSKVPLINHINEGVSILRDLNAWPITLQAFCLHPLIQHPDDYALNYEWLSRHPGVSQQALELAVEYRNAANAYLCKPETDDWNYEQVAEAIGLAAMHPQVKKMLRADKRQNQKDFLEYHYGKHERSDQLNVYFLKWRGILDDYRGLTR